MNLRSISLLLLLLPVIAGGCHRKLQAADLTFPDYSTWPELEAVALESQPSELSSEAVAKADPARVITAEDLAVLAAGRHPKVLQAQSDLDEARAGLLASGAWDNPELEGEVIFGEGGVDEAEAALMFTLPVGGRTVAARKLALLEVERARGELHGAIKEARFGTAALVAQLAHARAELEIWTRLADRSSRYAAAARQQEAAGLADPVDISLVLGDAARDQRELVRSRSRSAELESDLRQVAGLAPGDAKLEIPANARFELAETRDALIDAASEHRDAWRAATLDVQIADQAAALADLERIPDLSLGPALRTDFESAAVGVAVGIPIPIFAPGTAAYRAALARRDRTVSAQGVEARATVAEISDLVARIQLQHDGLHALEMTALPSSEAALEMAEGRYQSSAIDVMKLLGVHRAFAGQELERQELLLEQQMTLIELQRAVGRPVRVAADETEGP